MRLSYDPDLLDELHDIAIAAGREAGAVALEGQRAGVSAVATKSSATDVVTEWDRKSEALLVDRILSQRPDDGIVGEEGADHVGETGVRWIIDPIDGTVNYLYGQPSWAVSIAAEIDGVVVVGVVDAPVLQEIYVAVKGRGARLHDANGVRTLRVNDPVPLSSALVGTGFGYSAERRRAQGQVLAGLIPQVRDVRRLGACAVDLCHVAAGRLDAYFERGLNSWDLAAGGLVATEAGARVEGLRGAMATDELLVASGPGLFPAIHDALQELGADRD